MCIVIGMKGEAEVVEKRVWNQPLACPPKS